MTHNYWKYWVWAPKHGDGTAGSVDLIDIPVLCMLCGDQTLSNHLRSLTIWAAYRNQVTIVSVTSEITCFASEPNKASIYIPDSPLFLRAQHELLLWDYDHNQRIVGSSSPVRKGRPVKLCFVNLISSGCLPLLAKSQRSPRDSLCPCWDSLWIPLKTVLHGHWDLQFQFHMFPESSPGLAACGLIETPALGSEKACKGTAMRTVQESPGSF